MEIYPPSGMTANKQMEVDRVTAELAKKEIGTYIDRFSKTIETPFLKAKVLSLLSYCEELCDEFLNNDGNEDCVLDAIVISACISAMAEVIEGTEAIGARKMIEFCEFANSKEEGIEFQSS